jgi:hypothetical protein
MAGVLFLAAFAAYGTGALLVDSLLSGEDALAQVAAHTARLQTGAVLMLLNSVVVAAIGVVLAPILRERSATIATGYLATRLIEATLLAVGVALLLALVPLSGDLGAGEPALAPARTLAIEGNGYAYQIAMATLGLGSLPFCWLLLRTRLVPPLLASWGLAGYAIFMMGAVLELFGIGAGVALSIPGGLFEVAFGLWLITRGIEPAPPRRDMALNRSPRPA